MAVRLEDVETHALRTGLSERMVYEMIRRGDLKATKELSPGPGKRYWRWIIETPLEPQPLRVAR